MFKNPFSFDGRIRRTEYGVSMIIYIAVYLICLAIASNGGVAAIVMVVMIPLVWFVWAQGAKRCHDLGRSGWWQLIPFYPLVLIFSEGDPGTNEYGQNPKNPEQFDVLESDTLDGHMKN
jgi:uncharacterized membrane protein YhaH (DUF805 family)